MSVPSIKGAAFSSASADLLRLVDEGRLSETELEVRLSAEAVALLREKIQPASWYPIALYCEFAETLAFAEADGDRIGYWRGRGARTAERLCDTGLYQQLYATRDQWGASVGRIIMSIHSAIYNFTEWHYVAKVDGGFEIHLTRAEDFPNVARHVTHGFIDFMAQKTSPIPLRVTSARPTEDRVAFRGVPQS